MLICDPSAEMVLDIQSAKNSCLAYTKIPEGGISKYEEDINGKYTEAKTYMLEESGVSKYKEAMTKKCAILDFDETISSCLDKVMIPFDFGWTEEAYNVLFSSGNLEIFGAAIEFTDFCAYNDMEVYIITGRREKYRDVTIQCLENVWYTDLIMKPDEYLGTTQQFKTEQRALLEKLGRILMVNMGDKLLADLEDCEGIQTNAKHKIQMSNPFYRDDVKDYF